MLETRRPNRNLLEELSKNQTKPMKMEIREPNMANGEETLTNIRRNHLKLVIYWI